MRHIIYFYEFITIYLAVVFRIHHSSNSWKYQMIDICASVTQISF